ncbi:MAG: PAS domain S-box protein, partial [Acetobacteraceae bacterium]|nr:PAS domain S-box protein [Acetobacteraceae bacterium]
MQQLLALMHWKPETLTCARWLIRVIIFNISVALPALVALDPSLDVNQYAHTAWTAKNGFSLGNIYAMAQTPDGYLWLGGEFGLFRFDGVRYAHWQPPAGRDLPGKPYALLVTRDGTLWIGTFAGLATWADGKLNHYPELDGLTVRSLLEDHEGTVWAGLSDSSSGAHAGRLCAMRNGRAQCFGADGAFGSFVSALYEDDSGTLWAGAESGVWRWRPGPPRRYAIPGMQVSALGKTDDGRVLFAMLRGGLKQVVDNNLQTYPIRDPINPNRLLTDRELNSNKLLQDRNGGLWLGTRDRGLIHLHRGQTDTFATPDGLSGDTTCSLFEDREGDVWVATTQGLDRFRELPVTTISVKQRFFSNDTNSVIAAADESIWVGTQDGLARWKNGQIAFLLRSSGLPSNAAQSLFQDDRGHIWVFTSGGLAYSKGGRFVAVRGIPSEEGYSITGDKGGSVWISGNRGLSHMLGTRLVEHVSWSALGRRQQAKVVLADQGGVWISFLRDGGVVYLKDHQVRASYTAADGLGKGDVQSLQLDRDGALWAATEEGGLSRIKDGHVATLTTASGLPCDAIHFTAEDDDRSLWLYTACGLVRVKRAELAAWIADPKRRVEATLWGADDGVRLRPVSPDSYGPPAAKLTDGKLWFLTGEGIQVVDPHHLALNKLPPQVHIESVNADGKTYEIRPGMRLEAKVRDVWIGFTALSFVEPEKVHFKYKLEGQDSNWKEVINNREAHYSNLAPRVYRFRVIASNNTGVWNEAGDSLEFAIAPAFYQTIWFYGVCAVTFLALVWAAWQFRVHRLQRESRQLRDVIETIPAMAWTALPDGSNEFVNRRWLEYTGLSEQDTAGSGWQTAVHPDDLARHTEKWRSARVSGQLFEDEVRFRDAADGEYRWFLVRGVPLRDGRGKILKWYGIIADIEDRKRAEEERDRLRQLETDLAHINRVSVVGELAASIAHEVNQPLAGIVNNGSACLRFLARDVPDVQEVREAVRDIVRDGKRAGDVIARIRALTKRAPPPAEKLDLNETVREVLALIDAEMKRNSVMMQTRFRDDVFPVLGDRVQLQQVLLNLIMNGMEAMGGVSEGARQLVITTRNTDANHVQVTVQDSGTGLAAGMTTKIFEPFYSTKSAGMGMGLSICRSIIQSHGGRLWATNNDGAGASFHFVLPKYHGETSRAGIAGF